MRRISRPRGVVRILNNRRLSERRAPRRVDLPRLRRTASSTLMLVRLLLLSRTWAQRARRSELLDDYGIFQLPGPLVNR